jgi:uncharacterized protein YajQ (UPF0234 family)
MSISIHSGVSQCHPYDIVSEVDLHEVANAIEQTNREVANRFDFKGTNTHVTHRDAVLTVHADNDFQIRQVADILHIKNGRAPH